MLNRSEFNIGRSGGAVAARWREVVVRRWIHVWDAVPGDPAVFERTLRRQLPRLLADATGSPRPEPTAVDGSVTMRLTSRVLARHLSATVQARTGAAMRSQGRTVVRVSWEAAEASVMFPTFEGTIELSALSSERAALTIAGSYDLPLGLLGTIVDATVLHGVARRTLSALLARLAAALRVVAASQPHEPDHHRTGAVDPLRRGQVARPPRAPAVAGDARRGAHP